MRKSSFRSQLMAVLAVGIVLFGSLPAFATPTALTIIILKQNNYAVQAGDLLVTFTACDNVNGNSFIATGQEVLLVQNTSGSSGTFTVTSVADALGRTETSLTAYSVAAAGFASIHMKYTSGWISGSVINLTCSAATMKFAVLRYPN